MFATVLSLDDLDLDADFDPDAHDAKIAALFESGNDYDDLVSFSAKCRRHRPIVENQPRARASRGDLIPICTMIVELNGSLFFFHFNPCSSLCIQDGEKPTWDDEDGGMEGYGDESIAAGFDFEGDDGMDETYVDGLMDEEEGGMDEDWEGSINMVRLCSFSFPSLMF